MLIFLEEGGFAFLEIFQISKIPNYVLETVPIVAF